MAEPAQLDRLSVLTTGGESKSTLSAEASWGVRGKDSVRIATELRNVRPAGGKETFRASLALKEGETRFNLHNSPNFIKRFGGEHAGEPTKMKPEEKASFQKAEDVIKQNTLISLFLEAKRMPPAARNAHLTKMLGEVGMPTATYAEVRKQALATIANSSDFIAMFPEIQANFGSSPKNDILQFIEDTLVPADDQRLASRIGTRTQEAFKKAVGLPLVGTDEERDAIEKQVNLGEKTVTEKIKFIADVLKARGIQKPGPADFTAAEIRGIIAAGGTPDVSGVALIQQAYLQSTPGATLANFESMRTFASLPAQITEASDRIKAKLTAGQAMTDYIRLHPTDDDVMTHAAKTSQRLGYLRHYAPSGTEFAKYERFSKNFLPLLEQNSLTTLASETRQAQMQLEEAKIRKSILPPTTADVEKSRDIRILAEEDLLGELDGILGQSIKDVMEERYDVMEERMDRLMQDKVDKSEKNVKINIMNLRKKMSDNWIKYDQTTRKKTMDKDKIRHDVTHLTYAFDKDVALKQLIARDLFGVAHFDRINVIDGTDMNTPANSLLTPEQIKQMDSVFKEAGTEYRDKLFADMFAARGTFDRTLNLGFGIEALPGWAKLGFKRDEWKYMMQRYEPDVTKALEANHDAHTAMKTLEGQ
ncbi:MAG: hypothetical protein NTV98_03695, partial [Candidatus Roizmanbacteria bacterium]|nr:hypothetical protein [Candidatus Roizmanbacteria bacterium]